MASSVRRGNRELLDRKPQLGRLRVHYYGQESHSGVKALMGWECSAPGGHKTVGSKEVRCVLGTEVGLYAKTSVCFLGREWG